MRGAAMGGSRVDELYRDAKGNFSLFKTNSVSRKRCIDCEQSNDL